METSSVEETQGRVGRRGDGAYLCPGKGPPKETVQHHTSVACRLKGYRTQQLCVEEVASEGLSSSDPMYPSSVSFFVGGVCESGLFLSPVISVCVLETSGPDGRVSFWWSK